MPALGLGPPTLPPPHPPRARLDRAGVGVMRSRHCHQDRSAPPGSSGVPISGQFLVPMDSQSFFWPKKNIQKKRGMGALGCRALPHLLHNFLGPGRRRTHFAHPKGGWRAWCWNTGLPAMTSHHCDAIAGNPMFQQKCIAQFKCIHWLP
jgi:hypothetical protein